MSGSRPDNVLTLGSLFSGIGGLEYGLEMTGRFKTVWQVEKDAYCRKVLAKHWPDVTRYEDVKDVGKENLSPVDVICGGFPCQDISSAGNRAGIGRGTRSGLWHEYARIIDELRPRFVVVENVSALLIRGVDVVLGTLASIGYDAEWTRLSASDVGAPHQRERIFLVAYPALHGSHNAASEAVPRAGERHPFPRLGFGRGAVRRHVHTSPPVALHAAHKRTASNYNWWVPEPALDRVVDEFPGRVDRVRALGNAVVPQCARVVGEWLLEIHDELTAVA